jgi:hypothetical protein
MEESIGPVLSCLPCEGQRIVDPGQGCRCVALSFVPALKGFSPTPEFPEIEQAQTLLAALAL